MQHPDEKKTPLLTRRTLLGTAILMTAIPAAQAQQEPQVEQQTLIPDEEMLIVGQTAQIRRALADQRDSDVLKSIIHSDGINALPDDNAAEALQRLPGVSIERDQGEGRFVRIRGTAPNLNNTTIDGVRVPAPEDDQRAVALDVLPTDLIDSLVVTKALTPDMDADAVGGSVDVRSVSALDKDGPYYKLSARAGYNQLTEDTSPKLGVSGGRAFELAGGRLGVATALSFEDREFGSDNIETGGGWNFEGSEPALEEIEQRDYTSITRERVGLGVNIDFEQDANNRYYLRTMYTEFEDDEQRNANIIEFDEPLVEGASSGEAEFERELKDRIETQEILSLKLGAEHRISDWTLEYEGSFSKASEEEGFEEPAMGEAIFVPESPITEISFTDTKRPLINKPDNALDNENFVLDSVELERNEVTDEEFGASFDLKRDFTLSSHAASIKLGAKMSRRTKERDLTLWAFEDFEDKGVEVGQLGLEDFSGGVADWPFGQFGDIIDPSPVRALLSDMGPLEGFFDEEASRIEDFEIDEDINAAYLMGTIDINKLRLVGGVRYEDTSTEGLGTRFDAGQESFDPASSSNDYDNLLPSIHARYALTEKTLIRASFFQSLARPVFEQLSPAIILDEDEAEFGNPNLDPLEANNFDLGIEHYISDTSAVSVHLFYKDIENFVFETDLAGTGLTRRGLDMNEFSEAVTFENGESGDILGAELSGSHRFSGLPGIWSGLLVNGNVSLTESDASISGFNSDRDQFERRDISFPRQSDVTANLSLGYETQTLSLRLAASFKSEHLLETGDPLNETQDIYEGDHFQLDFSGNYNLTDNLKVSVDLVNLTDRPFYAFQNREGFNAQLEQYERTFRLGVTYSSF